MQKIIQTSFPFQLDLNWLLKKTKVADDPDDEDYQVISAMLRDAGQVARPKYAFGIAAIDEKKETAVLVEGHLLESALVRRNLDQSHRILPYVATCGSEIDQWSLQFTDIMTSYWADEIKNHTLHQAIQHMHKTVRDSYFADQDLSQMSPGSLPEWPILQQKPLFGLMADMAEAVGVTLTDSCLMIPAKSVSGFYFSAGGHFENCRLCPRTNCPGRRVPYEPDA